MNDTVTRSPRTQSSGKSTAMSNPIKLQEAYGQCCCCCELPCIKSIWSEYMWMGNLEVYGDMLQECFNIAWPQIANTNYQICEVCITQLRNALQFKRRILHNHITILDAVNIEPEGIKIKVETDETNTGTREVNTETYIFGDNPRADVATHDDDGNSDSNMDPLEDIHQPDTKDGGTREVNTETYIFGDNLRADAATHDDDGNSDGNIDPLEYIHQPDTKDDRDIEKRVQEAIFNNNKNGTDRQNSEETQNVDITNEDDKSIIIMKEHTSHEQEIIPTSGCKDSFKRPTFITTGTSNVVSESTINNANEAINPEYNNTGEDENTQPTSIKDENGIDESPRPSKTRRLTKSRCQVIDTDTIMPINTHITERERCKIVLLREHGRSIADIARQMGVARNTVYRWIRRWKNEGNLNEGKRTGRPRKTSLPQDFNIVHQFRENPFCQTRNVATSHNVSLITVRRRLREAGMKCRLLPRKRRLTDSKK